MIFRNFYISVYNILIYNLHLGGIYIKLKIFLIFLLLFVCIGLSCVSAQDNQTNDSMIMEEGLIEGNVVSGGNDGDFSELNDTIYNSDNFLKLEKDYVYNSSKDENFSSGIVIEKDNFVY